MSAVYHLRPEPKFERAQEAQRGVIVRVKALIEGDVSPVMGPDELEMLALQFQLAAANLRTAARDLRECEEERRRLAAWRTREDRRFEWVPEDDRSDLSDLNDEQPGTENGEPGTPEHAEA